MALIPPRRGEPVVHNDGTSTTRFAEYLERTASQVTDAFASTEIDPSTINLSTGTTAAILQRLANVEATIGIQPVNALESRVHTIECALYAVSARISRLQKQIDELKVLQ